MDINSAVGRKAGLSDEKLLALARNDLTPFSQDEFLSLMALARKGVARLVDLQKMAVA